MVRVARLPLLFWIGVAGMVPQPAAAVTQNASVKANVVKPLTLTALQDLDLGTITLGPGAWTGATVGISQSGFFSCNPNVICSGAPKVAQYKVTGTNKMVVGIAVQDVMMVNQNDVSKTLTLKVDSPSAITLTSSGEPGITFGIGGTITLSSTTPQGSYSGTFDVTVDYQ